MQADNQGARRGQLSGVLCVFQTPWLDDESLDRTTLLGELDWLVAAGADGVVMAMVSELLRMSSAERDEVAELVCGVMRGRGATVISVGAESSRVAGDHARHAEACGADALMAIPPVATALGDAAILNYYRSILDSTSLPLVVQDASGYVGRPIPIPVQVALLNEFGEDRVWFKPEAPPIGQRLSALREASEGRARVFEGTGGIALVDSYRRGVVGTMPGADLARAVVALWRALGRDDQTTADAIHGPLAALVSMQTSLDAFLAVEKHLLVLQGVFTNTVVRGPCGFELDEETRDEVERLFALLMAAIPAPGESS
jgi:dihydrodipicolinate synthase/N-acetylneuraminate lyase